MHPLVNIAVGAARRAGEMIVRNLDRVGGVTVTEKSRNDFVSEVDRAAEQAAITAIRKAYPDHGILAEESGSHAGDEYTWVIDPLDGTTSFIHGYPTYSVSVALVSGTRPVAGAVYNAAAAEMNAAAEGMGATRDGVRLRASDAARIQDALVITGFPYDRGEPLTRQLAVLAAFLRAPVHGVRRDGSAAVDICHVAAGRADGFWEYALQPWDMAAGVIIARESGALVTDAEGHEWSAHSPSILVANPILHARMLSLITQAQ